MAIITAVEIDSFGKYCKKIALKYIESIQEVVLSHVMISLFSCVTNAIFPLKPRLNIHYQKETK